MRIKLHHLFFALLLMSLKTSYSQELGATNPLIFADVPDMSMIRVGGNYYMSSTTMHMSPGVPIMKSTDLVNWQLINYAYDRLGESDAINLENGETAYGRGSWASCLRYHNGKYYLFTFSATTGKTHVFITENIENGSWQEKSFEPAYHDLSVFFEDDGKIYMIWGNGRLMIAELETDFSGVVPGSEKVLLENASAPAGNNIMLGAEGSQLFKVDGKYYLFNITWPTDGMRTVLVYRSDKITGPYEGKVALQDKGIAQGGLIDTPDGNWYSYLFRDYGSVGRIPYLAPVTWEDGWPVIGINGKVPDTLDLPRSKGLLGIVTPDDFNRKKGDETLPLAWQWNHNPEKKFWSLKDRHGYLRLTNGRLDSTVVKTKNTLTQRTIGPKCSGSTALDISEMKEGDSAGLVLLQKNYGWVGVSKDDGQHKIIMVTGQEDTGETVVASLPLDQEKIYLKAECDFTDKKDEALFYYSLNGKDWSKIGGTLHMSYTLPHFMGYRFGLFNYATKITGGFIDFDFFKIVNNKTQ